MNPPKSSPKSKSKGPAPLTLVKGQGLPTRAELALCQDCALKSFKAVPGELYGAGEVMIVGEAPGRLEADTGRPFVGDSGRLLRRWLEETGLSGNVYITNVVKHRPPGNRNPEPEEMLACVPYLGREVAVIDPKVIVLAGKWAMALAFPAVGNKVLKTHGRWATLPGTDIPCVAMVHPAYVVRQSQASRGEWEGACLSVLVQARRKAEGVEDAPVKMSWTVGKVEPVRGEAPSFYCLDIETTCVPPMASLTQTRHSRRDLTATVTATGVDYSSRRRSSVAIPYE